MARTTPPQTLAATRTFGAQAQRAGVSEEELKEICDFIANDPQSGSVIAGTGGARKVRHSKKQSGKSGGWRTIHYWGGDDIPIFLLSIYDKSQKDNLSQQEKNNLKELLQYISESYRENIRKTTKSR
jgi:hypothetical protein